MTLSQTLLNVSTYTKTASLAASPRMSEQQARRVIVEIKRAQEALTAAKGQARTALVEAKQRDQAERVDRQITAMSMERRGEWFGVACEVARG